MFGFIFFIFIIMFKYSILGKWKTFGVDKSKDENLNQLHQQLFLIKLVFTPFIPWWFYME